MPASRGLFVRNDGTVGTTPIEARLALGSLFVESSPGVPRNGLLDQASAVVVTGTSGMAYAIAPCSPVVARAANEGAYLFTIAGTTTVTTDPAPATGFRWDLVYVKQNDPDKGDIDNAAVAAVIRGVASATPTKPYDSVPEGAYVLAEVRVAAGATSTTHVNVSIAQVWRYTALAGNAIPVRTLAERNEITPTARARAIVFADSTANNGEYEHNGTAWGRVIGWGGTSTTPGILGGTSPDGNDPIRYWTDGTLASLSGTVNNDRDAWQTGWAACQPLPVNVRPKYEHFLQCASGSADGRVKVWRDGSVTIDKLSGGSSATWLLIFGSPWPVRA